MTENSELEFMDSENLKPSCPVQETQYAKIKSDSFVVDMERFNHLPDKDLTSNSRVTMQRSLSRKGSQRGGDKKISNSNAGNERDPLLISTSPRGGISTPEKPMVVIVGPTDNPADTHVHHQITIMTGKLATSGGAAAGTTIAESKIGGKRFSFRRSTAPAWAIDPRRILLFFATLSSIGTILLIYFTLSMSKPSGDDNTLNW